MILASAATARSLIVRWVIVVSDLLAAKGFRRSAPRWGRVLVEPQVAHERASDAASAVGRSYPKRDDSPWKLIAPCAGACLRPVDLRKQRRTHATLDRFRRPGHRKCRSTVTRHWARGSEVGEASGGM